MATADRPDGRRMTAKGRATRERILQAAAELILAEGLSELSLDKVRKAASVSGSQLAHYYADKQQDTVLLRGTVAENIAFGRPDATAEQIVRAAERANADEFISRLPDGYDSMIGDRGATLSGGQRQRIGIAAP
jgi:ABC-type multidrug transport system fused ATPase/permease subunit